MCVHMCPCLSICVHVCLYVSICVHMCPCLSICVHINCQNNQKECLREPWLPYIQIIIKRRAYGNLGYRIYTNNYQKEGLREPWFPYSYTNILLISRLICSITFYIHMYYDARGKAPRIGLAPNAIVECPVQ